MSFPFLDNATCVGALTPWSELVDRLESGMSDFSSGKVRQPVRASLRIEEHNAYALMMPCYSPSDRGLCCKLLYVLPDNETKYGLPTMFVYVLSFDAETGAVKALMEGGGITERRTAAASALASRWLCPKAPEDVSTLAILGAGRQGLAHIQVLCSQYKSIGTVRIWNRTESKAKALLEAVTGWLPEVKVTTHSDVGPCVDGADLVVTGTYAPAPILLKSHLSSTKAPMIMAVGAASTELQELDPALLTSESTTVVADSKAAAQKESGDVVKSGCKVLTELGEVIAKGKKGTPGDGAVVYKSLGVAVQDLVGVQMIGQKVDLTHEDHKAFPAPYWDSSKARVAAKAAQGGEHPTESVSVDADKGVVLKVSASMVGGKYVVFRASTGKSASGGRCCDVGLLMDAVKGTMLGVAELDGVAEAAVDHNVIEKLVGM